MKGAVAALIALPFAFLVLLVIPIMGGSDDEGMASMCSPTGGGSLQLAASGGDAWGGYSAAELANASIIVKIGAQKNVTARGQQIALMTAIDESGLIPQKQGGMSADNPETAWGLFQQTPKYGWGTRAQVMDPVYATSTFYDRLLKVPGWQTMPPTLAAHAVQGNRDPNVYAQFWDQAGDLLTHLTGGSPVDVVAQDTTGGDNILTSVLADIRAYCDSADNGGHGFAVNAAVASVGPYSPVELNARAKQFAAGGGGWLARCQNFVAQLAGRPNSGYYSAASAMATFRDAGVFHEANDIDGHAPPIGAWLYYSNSGPYGHVTTYLGNGKVAGTDTWQSDRVGIGPASDVTDGKWHLKYEGWAVPWATPATDVQVKAPRQSGSTTVNAGAEVRPPAPAGTTQQGGSFVIASQNILGASHTDGKAGHGLGGDDKPGWPSWEKRLPYIFNRFAVHGVTVAGLQEVQPSQVRAIRRSSWGVYGTRGNLVVWDNTVWAKTTGKIMMLPYFERPAAMPIVQLRNRTTGAVIAVMSVHNARVGADANRHAAVRIERQLAAQAISSGIPFYLVGDFNDHRDGRSSAACELATRGPMVSAERGNCANLRNIDHIFATSSKLAALQRDATTMQVKAADHPMVYTLATPNPRR